MGFDDCGDDDAVGASTAATDGEEEVGVLARVCGDESAICKDDLGFQDLVGAEAKVMDGGAVTPALHPAAEAAYGLRSC